MLPVILIFLARLSSVILITCSGYAWQARQLSTILIASARVNSFWPGDTSILPALSIWPLLNFR
jgi:hypothetical protein